MIEANTIASVTVTTDSYGWATAHAVVVKFRSGGFKKVYQDLFHHHCARVKRFLTEFPDVEISKTDIEDAAFDRSFD